jgi:predicted ferric reductase
MNAISRTSNSPAGGRLVKAAILILLVGLIFVVSLGLLWVSQSPFGGSAADSLSALFATGTVQAWWYVTRAAGLTSYFLLWLSMVWGMGISTRFFHPAVEGAYSYDFHEFLSLLGLGFVLLHVVVLLFDKFIPFNVWQILVPFVDSYRPLWVGMGIIGFYIFLLVTVTFYIKQMIGVRAFRSIHALSLLGYLGATLHGLFAGTDSALPVTKVLYAGTFVVVLFLTVYWIVLGALTSREKALAEARAADARRQPQRLRASQR